MSDAHPRAGVFFHKGRRRAQRRARGGLCRGRGRSLGGLEEVPVLAAIEELCRDTGNVSYFSVFVIKELRPLHPQSLLCALPDTDS